MRYSDFIIYVDESGDHSLESIDKGYPIFVLDFCIFRKDHYIDSVVPNVQRFKFEHFGHDAVVLHEYDIRRQQTPFVFLKTKDKREVFMEGLERLIVELDFTIVATAIHKDRLVQAHQEPSDPYELALTFCMEVAHEFLRDRSQHDLTTHIVVERRGKKEDRDLEFAFRRIRDGANRIGAMPGFEIVFADKRINSAGLQLADLTARPIGRYVLEPNQDNRSWLTIKPKLFQDSEGSVLDRGLRVFPPRKTKGSR